MDAGTFARLLEQEGYLQIVTVEREADGGMAEHSHPFEAKALILDGEIRIIAGSEACRYLPGDIFYLRANETHTESYGPQGVKYLVGRK
ncbi:MAG TPA: cupin domain-containing protein [Noviherbaspirillum sp.]|uniref:cupin domain-containing protein n=1 Tax=Noviherbaspirillum sp. TaxID=1926288 RepID=UPI002D604E8B|nr:cupin domain-containing protein [Noviherbaspirillum sp.]HYD94977.1 cupin domain-containing protein [Noviherbaspirillum sp.]